MVARKTRQGGFVGIQQYLDAQGQGAGKLAGQVGQRLTGQHGEAQKGITGLQSQFGTQAQAGQTQDLSQQIRQDPTKVTTEDYQRTMGGYQGPSGLQDIQGYGNVLGDVTQFGQRLGMTGSQPGQGVLLQEQFGRPSYTRGQTRLDTALLSADPTARGQFSNLRQTLGGLGQQLGTAEQTALDTGQQYRQAADLARKQSQAALTGSREQLMSDLEAGAAALNAQRQAEFEAEQARLQSAGAYKSALGKKMAKTLGAKKIPFLQAGAKAGISEAATAEQRARDAALGRLAGSGGYLGEARDIGSAFTFDQAGYDSKIAADREIAKQKKPKPQDKREPIKYKPDPLRPAGQTYVDVNPQISGNMIPRGPGLGLSQEELEKLQKSGIGSQQHALG